MGTNRSAASRYAKALLDVSIAQGHPERVEHELVGFLELVNQHASLGAALFNPSIPSTRKRTLVETLLARASMTDATRKLLLLLAERDRLTLLSDLVAAYRVRLLDYLQVVRAEITTATPLRSAQAKAIEERLADLTGKTVSVTTVVDAAIIGGVVAKIGSLVYDGSIARHLQRLKEKLVEGA